MTEVHSFASSLAFSHDAENWPGWLDVYQKAFPTMVGCFSHREDGEHQRAGIDRSILLANSKQLLIDEKVRRKKYADIALEFLSDVDRGIPGWVVKQIRADYIAYAILPAGVCYLLPVLQLQAAWSLYSSEWTAEFGIITALNSDRGRRWRTQCVCVPVPVLYKAIGSCLRIHFEPVG